MPTLQTTVTPFNGGITSVAGSGQVDTFTFASTWNAGDEYTVTLTNSSTGVQYQYGAGQATGQQPTFCFTYQNKVYFLAGATVYFSTAGNPVQFNDVTSGSPTDGFVTMSDYYGNQESLVSMGIYQGKLVFFSRNTTQIWSVDANPSLWVQEQVFQNIGTFAPASVQPLGDLDVFFLADTGIRSLRVRDSSNNAFVNDIGSPIDDFVQEQIATVGQTAANTSCSIVEPTSGRYWCAIGPTSTNPEAGVPMIYVLSYFPSSKVIAWSTYTCNYLDGTFKTFYPVAFRVYNGLVYCLAQVAIGGGVFNYTILVYGGLNNSTYDGSTLTVQTPYMDCGAPGNRKTSYQIDALFSGTWTVQGNMNIYNQDGSNFKTIVNQQTQSTTNGGIFPWTDTGPNGSLLCTNSDAAPAVLSSLIWHFNVEDFI